MIAFIPIAILCLAVISQVQLASSKRPEGIETLPHLFEVPKYGPWIVQFDRENDHSSMKQSLRRMHAERRKMQAVETLEPAAHTLEVTKEFSKAIHGMVVTGVTEEELYSIADVSEVYPDTEVFANAYSWGTDRIDSPSGLDNAYNYAFSGAGSNVYVVDTGLDTTHIEFADNDSGRTVANIFNLFGDVSDNTDGNNHGTHCAGTVGGNSIGVAPGANIYGMKVLTDSGSGWLSGIVEAIEEVIRLQGENPGSLSTISMSLGGPCWTDYCVGDPMNEAIHSAFEAGILTVAAAGNNDCGACNFSPASAPEAITVGSTTNTDDESYFSNYGQCVDMWAPGSNIISAISSKSSGNTETYSAYSGTSMATPHVAGVLAQLWQKKPTASAAEVVKAMECDAVQMAIDLNEIDTLSKNLFIQTPKDDDVFGNCTMGDGCADDCNGQGTCHAAHASTGSGSTQDICHCDGSFYYGEDGCSNTEGLIDSPRPGDCTVDTDTTMSVSMYLSGYSWNGHSYAIRDPVSKIVRSYAHDGTCGSAYSPTRHYCMKEGDYELTVTGSGASTSKTWTICGVSDTQGYIRIAKTDGTWSCTFIDESEVTTASPTSLPTLATTFAPTVATTDEPTAAPTSLPTLATTYAPTVATTDEPTASPTELPTATPTETVPTAPEPLPEPAPEPTPGPTESGVSTLTCDPYTASNTNSARQNTVECRFRACGDQDIVISGCSDDCDGDQYISLHKGSRKKARNNNFCGKCSQITYSVPGPAAKCRMYKLQQGCTKNKTCGGVMTITGAGSLTMLNAGRPSTNAEEEVTRAKKQLRGYKEALSFEDEDEEEFDDVDDLNEIFEEDDEDEDEDE